MRTKVIFLTCILSAILSTHATAKVIYVDDDANGINNGTSWENAYTFLHDALTNAQITPKPVEIRVAQGTYKPDLGAGISPGDRVATFQLINKVNLIGGYAGLGQADPNARDIELYETILSGDLNNDDAKAANTRIILYEPSRADNSYRVITSYNIDETTSIDGFTITSGNANSTTYQSGGGIYNYYSNLTVSNCKFKRNSAYTGGGMYNYYYNPKFINCTFSDNLADNYGGGIYNYHGASTLTGCIFNGNVSGENGSGMYNYYTNPVLTNCSFNWNISEYNGGGIYNDHSSPSITECSFNLNLSVYDGGGIYNYYSNSTVSKCIFTLNISESDGAGIYNYQSNPLLTNCSFSENITGSYGGGIYNYNNSNPTVISCTFNGNSAYYGGGMYIYYSNPTLTNCIFSENTADYAGGGMYIYYNSNPTITNCTFSENFSLYYAGGMYIYYNSNPTITNCTFSGNSSSNYAGGMYNYSNSNPKLTNCIFTGNSSGNYGGGIYNNSNSNPTLTGCTFNGNSANDGGGMNNASNSNPSLTDCTFSENSCGNNGGGMNNNGSNPKLTNCILSENKAEMLGGGMFNYNSSNPALINCTFRKNDAEYEGGGIYNLSLSNPSIEKCLFSENTSGSHGGGMYNYNSKAKLMSCIFSGNLALLGGGGIDNIEDSNIVAINCTFAGNLSPSGNAVSCYTNAGHGIKVYPSIVELKNCILWDANEQIWNSDGSTITVAYCDVKGGQSYAYDPKEKIIWDSGNIDSDPCFVDIGYWDPNGTIDNSNDDFWVDGDYHVKSQAGRFDPNSQSWIIDNVTSPCIDAGDPNSPVYYEPNPKGGRINIGAYGGTIEASKSLYDIEYFNPASNPHPADDAVNVILDTMLNWVSDINAVAHEVYFGDSEYPPFVKKQNGTEFDPETTEPNTQYYWRIDEVDNSLNRVTGNIWTFTTGFSSAHLTNPYPANGAVNVAISTVLNWHPGASAVTFDVYFGTNSDDVNNASLSNPMGVLASAGQEPNYYNPGTLGYDQLYCWRVDETDSTGFTTKGDIWAFVTIPQSKGRGTCFTGQTPAWVDGKAVTISEVRAGQNIDAINKVEQLLIHEGTFDLYDLLLESGECITVANEHYFMAESGRWISSKKLEAGMKLRTAKGLIKIKSITKQSLPFTGKVYNLKIKDSDKYMVGKDALIVRDY